VSYLGSKGSSGAYQAIVASMPPHDTYIEAFLGTGVVMLAKPAAARTIGLDLDLEVLRAFQAGLDADKRFLWEPSAMAEGATPELHCVDAITFLAGFDYASAGRVLVYLDPPYPHATRLSTKRYRHELTDDDHRRLIAVARSIPAAVILSSYPSPLYDELVGDWRQTRLQVMTRAGPRTEGLWFNFPAGDVAWSTFAGRNFTDRQRIKRKAANWAAFYRAMPPGERMAVLAAILAVEDGDQTAP
jgi:DNA adenine methylase